MEEILDGAGAAKNSPVTWKLNAFMKSCSDALASSSSSTHLQTVAAFSAHTHVHPTPNLEALCQIL